MYSSDDIKRLKDKISDIDESLKIKLSNEFAPYRNEKVNILGIVREYIKETHRIIYGGIAHNEAIKLHSPKESFYSVNDFGDYDFYSPTPVQDAYAICDILKGKGFTDITAYEAQHAETYSIRVKEFLACDITYMPKFIFDNLPTIKINNIKYVHPHVAIMDYLRMFTDPLLSAFRWEKAIKRVTLLQKYYPLKSNLHTLPVKNKLNLLTDVFSIIPFKTCIFIDDYAYNYYVSKVNSELHTNYNLLNLENLTVMSTNYQEDSNLIYNTLQQNIEKLEIKEYIWEKNEIIHI